MGSDDIINRIKPVEVGCTVYIDGYKSMVTKITDDGVVGLVLDDGLITEFYYECLLGDIHYDDFADDLYIETERVPLVGDTVTLDINEYEYTVIKIDDGVATIKRQGEIKHFSLNDIRYDVRYGFTVDSLASETISASDQRKLDVYEVQNGVYEYQSLCELREIYTLLGQPTLYNLYGLKYNDYNTFIDSLQSNFGLLVFWTEWDRECCYEYKYCKVIQGAYIKDEI